MNMLMASTYRPGFGAEMRPEWPESLNIRPASNRPTLVLCLHPRCPCSESTLDALDTLLKPSATRPLVFALMALPDDADRKWTDNELVNRLKTVPGVTMIFDKGGRMCQAFDARTSGQTFVYGADGRLAFIGGLTPGRGESGPCEATAFLQDWLVGRAKSNEVFKSHVFGCALYRAPEVVR